MLSDSGSVDFYGLKLSNFTLEDLDTYLVSTVNSDKQIVGYGYSLGILAFFQKFKDFYKFCNSFELMVADGTIFYWVMRAYGVKLKTFLSIPQLSEHILNIANKKMYSLMLLGATEEINVTASKNLKNKYPGIKLLPGHHGYFKPNEEEDIIEHINKLNPNILFIGMQTPDKEKFAYNNRSKIKSNIIIPFGGMINVYAGLSAQPPTFIKRMGLASIYRLTQDPKKLFFRYLWIAKEIFFRILPRMFFEIVIKKNNKFLIPQIYNKTF